MTRETIGLLLMMGGVTYVIRALPLTLIRQEIKNPFIRSFLHYVPYVTLSLIVFPGIITDSPSILAGVVAFVVAVTSAYRGMSMFVVSILACVAVYVIELMV